jgi:hypothetical protein
MGQNAKPPLTGQHARERGHQSPPQMAGPRGILSWAELVPMPSAFDSVLVSSSNENFCLIIADDRNVRDRQGHNRQLNSILPGDHTGFLWPKEA